MSETTKKPRTTKKITNAKVPGPLPISFEQFSKDPWKAVQFLLLIGMVYLWQDNKRNYEKQIELKDKKIEQLESQKEFTYHGWKKSDSSLASANSYIEVLTTLGKIPK